MCNEQPLPLSMLPSRSIARPQPTFKDDERVDGLVLAIHNPNLSDRPPSLRPLDLGESSLLSRWPHHVRQKSSIGHSKRPSIGAPQSFRRLDHTEAQSQSLMPLRLGPVVLRESPVPDRDIPTSKPIPSPGSRTRSDSTHNLLPDAVKDEPYRSQRDIPFQRCQQRSSTMWPFPPQATLDEHDRTKALIGNEPPVQSTISTRSSSSSLRSQAVETGASSITPRPPSERSRPKRKRSLPSVRKPYADSGYQDLDREILELNTIVEERRVEASRDNSPEQHVPAIAPSMQVRARSETLDAIGSALSRTLTARDFRPNPDAIDVTPDQPIRRRSTSTPKRGSSRVSGWLSSIFPKSSTAHLPSGEPFYKRQPPPRPLQRPHSEASIRTLVTDMDSPSLTAASSPTSKGHSRSHTGESRMTPLSPATIYGGNGGDDYGWKEAENQWPVVMTPTSQVGLAL